MDFSKIENDARVAKECQQFLSDLERAHGIEVRPVNGNGTVLGQKTFNEGSAYGTGAAIWGAVKQQLKDEITVRLQSICRETEKLGT